MARFLVLRLGLIVLTLFVISLAIFAVTEVLPGDVATQILGQGATPENVATLRERLGLNDPWPVRYLGWVGGAIRGDLGESLVQRLPITEMVGPRLFNSMILASFTFFVAIPIAVAVGIWAGVHRNSFGDRVASMTSLAAISLPEFVTGVVLIIIFSTTLGWLPSSSLVEPGTNPLTRPQILVLPALTLTGVMFAYVMRMARANVIEVLETNYVRSAVLKGIPMRSVIWRHVVPNAMLPTISVISLNVGWLLGGLIVVENVFSYPGLGRLLLTSIQTRDMPLLQSLSLLIAAVYAISNLLADLTYTWLNPRIRFA
ncbi:MAG: ABC transporter permease [Chloroflexi bacterium]|nr:ABC transporter permease [Chloroflexota bacterium]